MTDPHIATLNVHCARCGVAMTCSPQDIASCACSTILLDGTTRAWIAANHSGCLCSSCLREEQLRSKKRDLSGR